MKVFTILVTGWKKIRFYVPMAKNWKQFKLSATK